MSKIRRFRDSITGLFTSKKHAKANPDTTQGINAKELGRTLTETEESEAIFCAKKTAFEIFDRMKAADLRVNRRFADNHVLGYGGLRVTVTVTIESNRE